MYYQTSPANKKSRLWAVFLLAKGNWFGPTDDELVRSLSVSEVDAIGGPEFARDKLPCNLQSSHRFDKNKKMGHFFY